MLSILQFINYRIYDLIKPAKINLLNVKMFLFNRNKKIMR